MLHIITQKAKNRKFGVIVQRASFSKPKMMYENLKVLNFDYFSHRAVYIALKRCVLFSANRVSLAKWGFVWRRMVTVQRQSISKPKMVYESLPVTN